MSKLYKYNDTLGLGTGTVSKLYPDASNLPGLAATLKQWDAIDKLNKKWDKILSVEKGIGMDHALVVEVQGKSGSTQWLAIETDGYTNSRAEKPNCAAFIRMIR